MRRIIQRNSSGIQVRYTVSLDKKAAKSSAPAPYVFKVSPLTNHDAQFIEVKEASNGKP